MPRKGVVVIPDSIASQAVYDEILLIHSDGAWEWCAFSSVPDGWVISGNTAMVCLVMK
jgi:hypothetical protein